jgi:hypothetical protein
MQKWRTNENTAIEIIQPKELKEKKVEKKFK